MSEEKTVIATKTYTITVDLMSDGTHTMKRINDGFNPLELIGIADFIAVEVREQIVGRILPDKIIRQVVVDDVG